MSPLQLLQGRRSFVPTLFFCLLVSLSTQPISAWIQQQRIISDHLYRSRGSFGCSHRLFHHEERVHQQTPLEDEPITPSTAGKAWNTIPDLQGGVSSAQILLSRRSIIFNIVLLSTTTTTMSANAATDTSTAVDIDPFATLDSIASGFGSSGAPLPTTKVSTPQVPSTAAAAAAAAAAESNQNPSAITSNLSPLEKALEESRKRKQIDPRTHG